MAAFHQRGSSFLLHNRHGHGPAHGAGAEDSASCQIVMNPDPGSDPSTYTFNNGVARNRTLLPIPGADGEGVRIVYNDGECVSGATPVVRMHQANVASLAGQEL